MEGSPVVFTRDPVATAAESWAVFTGVVAPAVRSLGSLARAYSANADDCVQIAAVWWAEKNPREKMPACVVNEDAYLATAARRHVLRKLRGLPEADASAAGGVFARLEARDDLTAGCAAVELRDLIASAEGDVKLWLTARVVDGMSERDAREELGWSRAVMEDVREQAGEWLLVQLEGTE
jgi:hypothetical protein